MEEIQGKRRGQEVNTGNTRMVQSTQRMGAGPSLVGKNWEQKDSLEKTEDGYQRKCSQPGRFARTCG